MLYHKNFAFSVATLFVFTCFLAQPSLDAAKAPKVDICHFDSDEGTYKLINISGNAVQKHIDNHGDIYPDGEILDADCNVKVTTKVFARAYINKDGLPGYDENVDIEIARLEDTNGDGSVGEGDTLKTSQFPKNFDFANPDVGDFTVTEHIIDGALQATPNLISVVQFANEGEFMFSDNGSDEEYFELNPLTQGFTSLEDNLTESCGFQDRITVQVNSPSVPDAVVPSTQCVESSGTCNNNWLEIDITL